MNEVMFVTDGELLQFLPISSKKRVGMSICFFPGISIRNVSFMLLFELNGLMSQN